MESLFPYLHVIPRLPLVMGLRAFLCVWFFGVLFVFICFLELLLWGELGFVFGFSFSLFLLKRTSIFNECKSIEKKAFVARKVSCSLCHKMPFQFN